MLCLMCSGQDAEDEMVNGDVATTTSDADRVRRQDIITISGKQEDCDAASTALRVSSSSSSSSGGITMQHKGK